MSLGLLSPTHRSASQAVDREKDSPRDERAALAVELDPSSQGTAIAHTIRPVSRTANEHQLPNFVADFALEHASFGTAAATAMSVASPSFATRVLESYTGIFALHRSLATPRARYFAAKRVMDFCGSLVALLVLSPVMAIAALLIKVTSRGPVLYAHTRVGERGRKFTCYKFRTMVINADQIQAAYESHNAHSDSRTFKIPNDPRVTAVGRWLRKLSIDEMPQFWNVLTGDMSLVGPRPPVPREVSLYQPGDKRRLIAKPGLTCTWQVSGRSRIPFPDQLEMDVAYIRESCLWLDVKLIARTIPAVLSADGAY
jgi:lipopolysaccharide/colanic/teichoic acid biosynthesis glycosyltransferase